MLFRSKCELPTADSAASRLDEAIEVPVRRISAVTGTGLGELVGATLGALTESELT